MIKTGLLAPVLIALAAGGGCSKGVSLKTVPVSGKVTLDDKPLAGATVTFVAESPANANAPPAPATGVTGDDGSYKLTTMASGRDVVSGAPAGSYKVIITKTSGGTGMGGPGAGLSLDMSPEERQKKMQSMTPEEMAKMAGSASQPGAQGGPKSEIPERYGKVGESGLTANVAATGAQTFDFPLTSQ